MSPTNKSLLIVFTMVFSLAIESCNNENAGKIATLDSPKTAPAAVAAGQGGAFAFGGYLNELYASKSDFLALALGPGNNTKLVLAFSFNNDVKQLLNGYIATKNGSSDDFSNKVVTLAAGRSTNVPYSTSTNFGDVVLMKAQVDDIKSALTVNKTGVVFKPAPDGDFIKYQAYVIDGVYPLTKDSSNAIPFSEVPVTGAIANPCPPRRYTIN